MKKKCFKEINPTFTCIISCETFFLKFHQISQCFRTTCIDSFTNVNHKQKNFLAQNGGEEYSYRSQKLHKYIVPHNSSYDFFILFIVKTKKTQIKIGERELYIQSRWWRSATLQSAKPRLLRIFIFFKCLYISKISLNGLKIKAKLWLLTS